MKRKSAFIKLITAVFCLLFIASFTSCSSSQNSLDRGKRSSYSKVREHQPSWNSSTSPNVRYKLKKSNKKKSAHKKNKGKSAKTKSRTYSIFK